MENLSIEEKFIVFEIMVNLEIGIVKKMKNEIKVYLI